MCVLKRLLVMALIVTGNECDELELIPDIRREFFPFASASRLALGPIQPPVQWIQGRGKGGFFSGGKVSGA
jgi:hypothetical protein